MRDTRTAPPDEEERRWGPADEENCELPNCPLCEGRPTQMSDGSVSCQQNPECPLNEADGLYFTEQQWRRLAEGPESE